MPNVKYVLTSLADSIREAFGITEKLNLQNINTKVEELNTEINQETVALDGLASLVSSKTISSGEGNLVEDIFNKTISSISVSGIDRVGPYAFYNC